MPVQVANLSLEEIELKKYIEVGIASPIETDGERCRGTYVESPVSEDSGTSSVTRASRETVQKFSIDDVSPVIGTSGKTVQDFDKYLKGKLAHLTNKGGCTLEPVLRR